MPTDRSPIFVIGVPRSGTTLLRVLLDSHPNIAAGPETPWFCAHHPRTLGALIEYLCDDPHGYCANFGGTQEEVFAAARVFVDTLLTNYTRRKGKARWAEKTPDNLQFLPFLKELFPTARFLHLRRDPLDVGLSTSVVPAHRKGVTPFNEIQLALFFGLSVTNNVFNAVLRWVHWERKIAMGLDGADALPVSYEELVRRPEEILRHIMEFLNEPWSPEMLNFMDSQHDFPAWEWGSADVIHYSRGSNGISTGRVGRAERELASIDREILEMLVRADDAAGEVVPQVRIANVEELQSDGFTRFVSWINSFAGPAGLRVLPDGATHWEYPWLWFHALGKIHWPGKYLIDVGSAGSALPWILAMLGARVTLIESDAQWIPVWKKLRDGLGVQLDWQIVSDLMAPLPNADADVLTSLSALERHTDKAAAIDHYARLLRPSGLLVMAFGVGEAGMHFPPWFGAAVTMQEFGSLVWGHPAFGGQSPPAWNSADIPAFRWWHLHTHEHRDYVTGGAILRRASTAS
jgi:2-polyprenyl-3-methyl-5-hydroxy-6-metoxy-1,4-benzoquinol methylase